MDKLAEEILDKCIKESGYETSLSLTPFWENVALKAMEEYHKAKLREELIKYHKYYCERVFGKDSDLAINPETLTIDEYLKDKQ